jgi:hypothetical protein
MLRRRLLFKFVDLVDLEVMIMIMIYTWYRRLCKNEGIMNIKTKKDVGPYAIMNAGDR